MPLEILAPLVVAGITLSIVLVRLLVNTPERLLTDEDMVQKVFNTDFPLEQVDQVLIDKDKRLALLKLHEKLRIGFVEVMGSKHVTRIWSASDISSQEMIGEKELQLKLSEFTLPRISLQFATSKQAATAINWLKEIQENTGNK